MNTFFIKQNDLLPEIAISFQNSDGSAINLTSASIKFSMVNCESDAVKVNASTATLIDALAGSVKYTWAGTDTDTVGKFRAEFEATLAGKKLTAPNNGYIPIEITDDLA